MKPLAIEVTGLKKSFGPHVVLDGIDLEVPAGSVFALLGPNGAGKTTLINILSTLVAPDEGTVMVGGYDVAKQKNEVKQAISLTGQFAAVDEILTGMENLRMMARLSGLSASESRAKADELLKRFDLVEAANKRVKTYSGGMRRRLDLAISLVASRSILFLDEPTTGLDTRSRRELWGMISTLAEQGNTIFLTTQYLEEADQLADTIALIANGRVIAQGTAEELKSRVRGEVLELRDESNEIIRKIPTDGSIQDIIRILHDVNAFVPKHTQITISKPSLDEVFISLTDEPMEGVS